jgi:zinc transporter, ZIP family
MGREAGCGTRVAVLDWLEGYHPIVQAAIAGCFTWLLTAIGASLVLLTRRVPRALLDAMLGFAAGVMIAASVWSLLIPAMEMAEERGDIPWLPAALGFILGAAFLRVADQFLPHLHFGEPREAAEGVKTAWRRTTLLVFAITLHNIPEGLAVGVAFAAAAQATDLGAGVTFGGAVALAIGIGLQNFPEGIAVAMPLRREGVSRRISFFWGQASASVEPVAAVIGAAAILIISPALPYALAFAAGAMIYVVVEELIPEAQVGGHADLATIGTIGGFTVMMVLDVALG